MTAREAIAAALTIVGDTNPEPRIRGMLGDKPSLSNALPIKRGEVMVWPISNLKRSLGFHAAAIVKKGRGYWVGRYDAATGSYLA